MEDREFLLEMIREYRKFGDLDNPEYEDTDRIYNAIENLLNRVKELERTEQEHQVINGELRERVKELEEENKKLNELDISNNKLIANMSERHYHDREKIRNSIPKSKIEKKLEELDQEEQELQNRISDEEREEYSDASISWDLCDIETRRRCYQELLKEKEG